MANTSLDFLKKTSLLPVCFGKIKFKGFQLKSAFGLRIH